MSERENTSTVEAIFASLNAHKPDASPQSYGEGYAYEAPGLPAPLNYQQSVGYFMGFIAAFPDLHIELQHKIAQGDFVAVDWVFSGTNSGPMAMPSGAQVPPTGKKVSFFGSTTYRFKDGKAIHTWVCMDVMGMMMQLGMMPAM